MRRAYFKSTISRREKVSANGLGLAIKRISRVDYLQIAYAAIRFRDRFFAATIKIERCAPRYSLKPSAPLYGTIWPPPLFYSPTARGLALLNDRTGN